MNSIRTIGDHLPNIRKPRPCFVFQPFKPLLEIIHASSDEPEPRSGHGVVAVGEQFYSFGGYNPDLPAGEEGYKELWRYHSATHDWKLHASESDEDNYFPEEVLSNGVCFVPNKGICVMGGTGIPFGVSFNQKLYIYDVSSDDCTSTVYNIGFNSFIYGHSMTCPKGKEELIVFGGVTGHQWKNEVKWYSISSGPKYEMFGNPVEERYKHTAVFYDKMIVIFGGSNEELIDDAFQVLPVFHVGNRSWNQWRTKPDRLAGYPEPRRFHSGALFESSSSNALFVLCGGVDAQDRALDDIWTFHMTSKCWKRLRHKLPFPVYFHASDISPSGKMVIFGGVRDDELGIRRSNKVISLWVKMPSLAAIAWEAILFYNPALSNYTLSQLLRLKIDINFIEKHLQK